MVTHPDVVDSLRRQLAPTISESAHRERAEDIFYHTHLAIGEIVRRGLMRSRLQLGRWVRETSTACNRLSSPDDLDELRDQINAHLPQLGIKDYYVVVYRDADLHLASLLVACEQGQKVEASSEATFEASMLTPQSLRSRLKGDTAFAVLPLSHKTQLLGHALVGLDMERTFAFDELANALGAGLRSAALARSDRASRSAVRREPQ